MHFNGMHILYCTDNANEKKDQHADTNKKTGNQNYKICRNGFDGDGKHCNDQANQHQFVFPVFFLSHIQTALERNRKKYDLQLKQLRDTENRDKYKVYGELIHTYGYNLEEGAKELEALNYYTNEMIKIPLDPQKTPQENAKKYFDRYNKQKRTF